MRTKEELREFRRKLLQNKTPAEIKLEAALRKQVRGWGSKLHCQKILGFYIADFFYKHRCLVIEVDGKYHETDFQRTRDNKREAFFVDNGLRVIRFTNEEVLKNVDDCVRRVLKMGYIGRKQGASACGKIGWKKHIADLKSRRVN